MTAMANNQGLLHPHTQHFLETLGIPETSSLKHPTIGDFMLLTVNKDQTMAFQPLILILYMDKGIDNNTLPLKAISKQGLVNLVLLFFNTSKRGFTVQR